MHPDSWQCETLKPTSRHPDTPTPGHPDTPTPRHPDIPTVALFGQFGSQGALPLCYLSDSTSGSLKYTRFLVPVQYYFILLQTTMNSAGSRGTQVERRCSQMMSGSQWPRRRVLWCSAGCCAGSVERNPLSGFN